MFVRLRYAAATAGGVTVMALVMALAVPVASASTTAKCDSPVRYASSTNTVYVMSGVMSLSDIAAKCPSAPIKQVDARTRTWQVDANIVIQNGATLRIWGTRKGGLANVVRLKSDGDTATTVVAITAQYGTISIDSTKITSWDGTGPDTNPYLDGAATAESRARAFIRAISYVDPASGAVRTSRMDIANSDLGYLGWYAAESYGVSYKGRGCDAAHLSVCAKVKVLGSQRNSRFHNNFMGTYTYSAKNMVFDHNEYDHNVMYGLDPHDDSDYLTITRNHFHNNGTHGVICSMRCDHVTIAYNESDHNGMPPYLLPNETGKRKVVHGIMIHSGVTSAVIRNNYVHDQPNGAGIAVFDSGNSVIRNNTVRNNKYGVRLTVGARNVTFSANSISGSATYNVFAAPDNDTVVWGNRNGHPTDLAFTGNTFGAAKSGLAYLSSSDRVRFTRNRLTAGTGAIVLAAATRVSWQGKALPSNRTVRVR